MTYQERKQKRIEAAIARAKKARNESEQAFNTSSAIVGNIPMGQPILVGHHSEKRHRRDLERSENAMRKAVEADKKAEYYEQKAKAIANNNAISSDDENALDLIQEKIDALEKKAQAYKEINAIVRNKDSYELKVQALMALKMKQSTAQALLDPSNFGGPGIPSFTMSNNRAEIRRLKIRLEQLQKIKAMPTEEIDFDGGRIVSNVEMNRVQIFFDSRPSKDKCSELKKNGFKWAPSHGAWQRPLSPYSIHLAKQLTDGTV